MTAIEPAPSGDTRQAHRPHPFLDLLDGRNMAPTHRFLIGLAIGLVGVAVDGAIAGIWGIQLQALIPAVTSIAVGLYVGGWLAVPASYAGFVLGYLLLEGGLLIVKGADWWLAHAAESPGSGPVYLQFLGLMGEVAVFAGFFAFLAGAVALSRHVLSRPAPRS